MNGRTLTSALCLATVAIAFAASPAFAERDDDHEGRCRSVNGKILEVQIATLTGEPRVVGPVSGSIQGGNSSALKAETIKVVSFNPFALEADTVDIFVDKDLDMLVADGHALFTQIAGAPAGEVTDQLILTVKADGPSTGKFAGTAGTIHVVGVGHQFPPGPGFGGPGKTKFELRYSGQICRP
jgi:hypothetical protein